MIAQKDPEQTLQERFSCLAWLIFHAFALWSAAAGWLRLKRVCAWHEPKPIRMGGNPFARRVTHGMCPECFEREMGEPISKHDYLAGTRPVVWNPLQKFSDRKNPTK